MNAEDLRWRRQLARELTIRARAPTREVMSASLSFGGKARRIGITGPPGAGKSSLIALLAKQWTERPSKVGVLAVDPTSPLSGGSLLGDRIRMDEISANSNLFIRSLPSGNTSDGLCPNILSLLDAFDEAAFDHVILETVGVGQVSYQAKALVDTFVVVLVPESGDTVQAMKAGILELADIYVVNKADLPAAAKIAAELRSIALWRGRNESWVPPVILTSATDNRGASELSDAIASHRKASLTEERMAALAIARREYLLRTLLLGQIDELLARNRTELQHLPLAESLRALIAGLGSGADVTSKSR